MKADKSKMAKVDLTGGLVELNIPRLSEGRPEFGDLTKRFEAFKISDLASLERLAIEDGRFIFALAGIVCSGARPLASARTPYNEGKALLGRAFRRAPAKPWGYGPKPGVWSKAYEFVEILLPGFRAGEMLVLEWLASMPSHRRVPLTKAWHRLEQTGWKTSYEKFQCFVKTELLPAFSKSPEGELLTLDEMIDRLIFGPKDEAHVYMGPKLKELIKKLKDIWSVDGPVHYGSCGPEGLFRFLREKMADGPHQFFWCDFSMYDNTHSEDSWAFIEKLYRRAGISDDLFWQIFKAWMRPSGKIGPFRFKTRVMNASGRDDTALANAILNGVATCLSIIAALLRVDVLELTEDDVRRGLGMFSLSVCGDDSIGALPPFSERQMAELRERISSNLACFGFEAKLGTSPRMEDAVYLGMRPYPTRSGWFWGKTIGRSTYKMGYAMLKGKNDLMAHITGVADMHVRCSSHVPILSDLAETIVRLRTGMKRTPPVRDSNRPWEWTQESGVQYDDVTILSVAETYGVSVAEIQQLITQIHSVGRLPAVIDSAVWRRLVWVDDL